MSSTKITCHDILWLNKVHIGDFLTDFLRLSFFIMQGQLYMKINAEIFDNYQVSLEIRETR